MSEDSRQRLQKFLARAGVSSRRKAEELITEGKVAVNGKVQQQLGSKIDPAVDQVTVNGQLVTTPRPAYYIFHKPVNVISTMSDPQERPNLGDYFQGLADGVYPVGRLDFDVSGLMVVTNDGELGERLLHPRFEVDRVYLARVQGANQEALSQMVSGVEWRGDSLSAKKVIAIEESPYTTWLLGTGRPGQQVIEITVQQGKKHFVKNIIAGAGLKLIQLSRIRFGNYTLGKLTAGKVKKVSSSPF